MADQRQPFRFRLPWLPPTATAAPPPQPAPAPRPRQPAAAPPRPAFRPPGVGPAQAPPRANPAPPPPPTPPKPTSPPKTEPPSKPLQPASPKAIEQGSVPKPTSQPKTEPPSKPIAPTGPQTTPPQPASPKTEPLPKPIAPTGPQTTPPKTESPPSTQVSTPTKQPPMPPSPKVPSKPPSPSRSPARPKHSSPSSSYPPSPRDKALTARRESPSPTPKHPSSPTLSNQSLPSKKQSNSDDVVVPKPLPSPIQASPVHENGEPVKKDALEIPESETVLEPLAIQRKEMISTSGVGKRAAQTSSSSPNSYPKPFKPNHNHNHKPAPLQKEIKDDISKFVHKLGGGHGKQTLDGDKPMTVITLAGENRGAAMTLSNESSKKESPIHIHRGYRLNQDEGLENSTETKEGSKSNTDEETATKACINSNVQGINNSLLFNGSVSTMNPGVRYVRDQRAPGMDQEGSYEMRKAEVSGTQSEMLSYEPNVRRRCLRGLLMESSDSDTEKPRRHGCYYDRKEKSKSKDGSVDIL